LHYIDIAIFVLGYFILPHSVGLLHADSLATPTLFPGLVADHTK